MMQVFGALRKVNPTSPTWRKNALFSWFLGCFFSLHLFQIDFGRQIQAQFV